MIRLPGGGELPRLSSGERYGLSVLVDLSRLPPVESQDGEVVRLAIADDGDGDWNPADWIRNRFGFSVADGVVTLRREALRCVTSLAGAVIEQRTEARDKHGRVPSTANPLVAAGLERDPIVSRAGAALRDAVVAAAGRRPVRLLTAWPNGRRWAAALTHDLDVVAWWPLFAGLRVGELIRKGDVARALRVVTSALTSAHRGPVALGTDAIVTLEREHGLRATWFVLAGSPTFRTLLSGDVSYRLESPAARRILRDVVAAGHEVGLHGSFETMESADRFSEQRQTLATNAGQTIPGVRQHFLRMRPGHTQRAMAAAGFTYNATYGFPDRSGFRLGVADVVPGWDAAAERPAAPDEVPLMWMDRAASKYRNQENPDDWVDDALQVARAARDVDGLWVGLWHPNMTPALGYPGTDGALPRLITGLLDEQPFVGTLRDIVAWRVARRAARVEELAPDGRFRLAAPTTAVGTPELA